MTAALAWARLSFRQQRWVQGPSADPGAIYVAAGLELANGEVLTYEELQARGMDPSYIDEQGRMFASEEDMRAGRMLGYDVTFVVPVRRYGEVVLVVGAASLALGLGALLVTALVVSRRRPV